MSHACVDPYDVAIILGARLRADGTPSPALLRRVGHGVALLRRGQAGALLMTGGATAPLATGAPMAAAPAMRALALAAGVDPDCVHVEDRARNTIENALFSAPLVRARGWRRLVVVTDAFHVPRARYVFRRLGLPADWAAVRPARPSVHWWLAHAREVAALPWTVWRVEAALLR